MSMREYQAKFGDDIDFAAVALILAEVHQGYSSRTFLELDSPLYRRLRGIAAEVDAVMTDFRPDVVLTSGLLSTAQIHVAKAMRHRAAPCFGAEASFPATPLFWTVALHTISRESIRWTWNGAGCRHLNPTSRAARNMSPNGARRGKPDPNTRKTRPKSAA